MVLWYFCKYYLRDLYLVGLELFLNSLSFKNVVLISRLHVFETFNFYTVFFVEDLYPEVYFIKLVNIGTNYLKKHWH